MLYREQIFFLSLLFSCCATGRCGQAQGCLSLLNTLCEGPGACLVFCASKSNRTSRRNSRRVSGTFCEVLYGSPIRFATCGVDPGWEGGYSYSLPLLKTSPMGCGMRPHLTPPYSKLTPSYPSICVPYA